MSRQQNLGIYHDEIIKSSQMLVLKTLFDFDTFEVYLPSLKITDK